MKTFSFTAAVKLVEGASETGIFKDKYRGVSDVNVASREFPEYMECLLSCKSFMTDLTEQINARGQVIYKLGSEINPAYNKGIATISKDWGNEEVARLWIFDEKMEGTGQIHAVGQARLFQGEDLTRRLN
jgi:uncharacterized secreted protein with C-terminal beta-propeller domain